MDLNSYDCIVISSSGGKDSQAQLTHVVGLADAQGVSRSKLVVVHCDLGRVEWEGTRELAERQAKHYGLEFRVVSRPQGDLLTQIEQRGMFPSNKQRYCTSDHKRGQFAKVITALHREAVAAGHQGTWRVVECLGLRAQESSSRAKLAPVERNDRLSTKSRETTTWLPIHAWSVDHVWETIRASGVPHHRAYDLGMPRLSCVFCIFAPRPALRIAGRHNRALLTMYVDVEAKIGHTFRQGMSLASVRDEIDAGVGADTDHKAVESWTM